MFCDFESGNCDYDIGGSNVAFSFAVKTGEETTPDIFEDHNHSPQGHFLYASATEGRKIYQSDKKTVEHYL